MLYEVINVKQIYKEPKRRWFTDSYFDLIIWLDEKDEISGFQLCYNKVKDQHALTWHKESGYMHNRVDNGENRPGKYKQAPILIADGLFNPASIAGLFKQASVKIDQKIADLIYEKIIQYPGSSNAKI